MYTNLIEMPIHFSFPVLHSEQANGRESRCGLFEVTILQTAWTMKNLCLDIWCLYRHSNKVTPKYKSDMLIMTTLLSKTQHITFSSVCEVPLILHLLVTELAVYTHTFHWDYVCEVPLIICLLG
jgi:hypothetical protein